MGPFCTFTFTSKEINRFLDAHTKKILYLSLIYVVYASASNNIPSYTHLNSYIV